MGMPRVYDYIDYRAYLKAWFEIKREQNPRWTFGTWARQLRLKSPATLNMILNGHRHPGPKLIHHLCNQLRFARPETEYFQDLVALGKSDRDPRLSVLLLERIRKQNPRGALTIIDPGSFAAISHWHYYAIRELVDVEGFVEDPAWIKKKLRFKLGAKQIREAIQTLLRLGLLVRDEKGALRNGNGLIRTKDDLQDEGLKRFHEQTLNNARAAIRTVAPGDREISGYTFTFDRQDLPRAKEIIRRMHAELLELAKAQGAEAVYQLETALFPLTHFDRREPQ